METPDIEHRYREAIDFMQRAEVEIKRLRRELADQKEALRAMTIIAEETMLAFEALKRELGFESSVLDSN